MCQVEPSLSVPLAKGTSTPGAPVRGAAKPRGALLNAASGAIHLLSFTLFLYVWHWHTTPAASGLPGATGFGWFFRYLTFCSFTLQTLTLGLSCAAALAAAVRGRGSAAWGFGSDTLACAAFPLALTVTIMFFSIAKTTGNIVEGGNAERPPWLGTTVHVYNSLVAFLDLLLSPQRSFSAKSLGLGSVCAAGYIGWILVVRRFFGRFPYPFLEKMPYPGGFVAMAIFGVSVNALMFLGGRALRRAVRGAPTNSAPLSKKVA